jgi:hypothetical protein
MANNTGQKDNYPQNTTQKTNSWATLTWQYCVHKSKKNNTITQHK